MRTLRARLAPANGKCKFCKQGGELLACSFCAAVYHNAAACGISLSSPSLAASACFPWACPTCLKKGAAAVQRSVLKPRRSASSGRGVRRLAMGEATLKRAGDKAAAARLVHGAAGAKELRLSL